MDYLINPAAFSAAFTVPSSVVDRHLKLAKGEHLKVLLYVLRNLSDTLSEETVAQETGVSTYDVKEALLYWADAGVLLPKAAPAVAGETGKVTGRSEKPNRNDVAKRGAEDPKIRYLLHETQMRLGRNLKSNEASTLVWLYDDQGMDVSLILMIIQYAVANGKANMRFIETTAINWLNKGIASLTAADEELRKLALGEESWRTVSAAFGLERRKPSPKETELSALWVGEWGMSPAMLEAAYAACVDAKSKFSFAYTAKILEAWHEKGFQKPEDIKEKEKSEKRDNYAAYDLDLFEKMLNTKD